jgi:hypothetical protein
MEADTPKAERLEVKLRATIEAARASQEVVRKRIGANSTVLSQLEQELSGIFLALRDARGTPNEAQLATAEIIASAKRQELLSQRKRLLEEDGEHESRISSSTKQLNELVDSWKTRINQRTELDKKYDAAIKAIARLFPVSRRKK